MYDMYDDASRFPATSDMVATGTYLTYDTLPSYQYLIIRNLIRVTSFASTIRRYDDTLPISPMYLHMIRYRVDDQLPLYHSSCSN